MVYLLRVHSLIRWPSLHMVGSVVKISLQRWGEGEGKNFFFPFRLPMSIPIQHFPPPPPSAPPHTHTHTNLGNAEFFDETRRFRSRRHLHHPERNFRTCTTTHSPPPPLLSSSHSSAVSRRDFQGGFVPTCDFPEREEGMVAGEKRLLLSWLPQSKLVCT